MRPQVRQHFRPEFVNRVDDFVVFDGLSKDQIKFIVKLQAKRVSERLAVKKMKLQLDESAEDYLVVSPGLFPTSCFLLPAMHACCGCCMCCWLQRLHQAPRSALHSKRCACQNLAPTDHLSLRTAFLSPGLSLLAARVALLSSSPRAGLCSPFFITLSALM